MQTELQLKGTYKGRPEWNKSMQRQLAVKLAEIIHEWNKAMDIDDSLIEQCDDVLGYCSCDNAYELAKQIERGIGITPDAQLVESLDYLAWSQNEILTEHIQKWVKAEDIKPEFTEEDIVVAHTSFYGIKDGVIKKVNLDNATYNIYMPEICETSTTSFVINYENTFPSTKTKI